MRKALTLPVLLAALFAACTLTGSALTWTDVQQDSWFSEEVQQACDRGLMEGSSDGLFHPQDPLTRAQFTQILYRLDGAAPAVPSFPDVSADAWYADAAGWAQQEAIVTGDGDGAFLPEREITRQELMVMLDRYCQARWIALPEDPDAPAAFADLETVADWARDAVERLRTSGLVRGDGTSFQPQATATRAEAAALSVRLAQALEQLEPPDGPAIGGIPLDRFALWTDQPEFADLAAIGEVLTRHTGITLETASEAGERTIVFTTDETLPRLACSIREADGTLTFAVSTRYALPYLPRILEDFLTGHDPVVLPAGFADSVSFTLDQVDGFEPDTVFEFAGETDRNPLSYASGSDVTFRISFLQDRRLVAAPTLRYDYRTDDGQTENGQVSGHSGQLILTVPGCDVPGTAKLTVQAADREGKPLESVKQNFIGSVVFDFADITTCRPEPEDFWDFWQAQMKTLLASRPQEVSKRLCTSETAAKNPDWETWDTVVRTPWSDATVHITVPKQASPHSLKLSVRVSGYGFSSFGPHYDRNAICVSVNPHSFRNDQDAEYYKQQQDLIRCWVDDRDTREDAYFLPMLMRDIQAIRYAEETWASLWDGTTIEVSGGSMGGFQTIAISALYPKVTSASVSVTWMCDLAGGNDGRNDGWAPPWSEAGQYYDTCYFAAHVRCPVRGITAGLGDYTSPPSGQVCLYNALQAEKNITFFQNYKHGGEAGQWNGKYSITGDPTALDPMEHPIRDTGCAVPEP